MTKGEIRYRFPLNDEGKKLEITLSESELKSLYHAVTDAMIKLIGIEKFLFMSPFK